jgi:hypothetical protein
MRLRPDQWLPLANATNMFDATNATDMFHNNITSNSNGNATSSPEDVLFPDLVPEDAVTGKDWAFRWLLVVLFCLCAKPRIPDERYHRRRRRTASQKEESPKVREERIEQSITVQQVLTADAQGGLTLGEPSINTDTEDSHSTSDSNAGDDDYSIEENDETSTCIICLEPFRVGDTVAWSKQSTSIIPVGNKAEQPCLHVFHHDCIVPWLTNPQHDDCPACRSVILQDSSHASPKHDERMTSCEEEEEEEDGLEAAPNSNSNSLPFVIIHGLVSRVHHASCSLIGQSVEMNATTTTADGGKEDDDDDDDDDDRLSCVI